MSDQGIDRRAFVGDLVAACLAAGGPVLLGMVRVAEAQGVGAGEYDPNEHDYGIGLDPSNNGQVHLMIGPDV